MSARQLKVGRFWCGRILRRLYSRPGCDEIDFNSSAIPKKFERNGVVAVNVCFGSFASILASPRHIRLGGDLGNAGCPVLPVEGIGLNVKETSSFICAVCCV